MASLSNGNGNGSGHGHGNGRPPKVDASDLLSNRLPPQNTEAEQWVLGEILLDNDVLHEVVPILTVGDFYREAHQVIYRAVRDLYDLGKAVDAVILAEELNRRNEIENVGGPEFIAELANSVPHSANARYHADIVKQKSVSRQLIESTTRFSRKATRTTSPPSNSSNRPSARSSRSPKIRPGATPQNSRT